MMNDERDVKKAIFVFRTTPLFPMGGILGVQDCSMGKSEKYVEALNKEIQGSWMRWKVIADESMGEIAEIEKENPDILICVNGLQTRFFCGDFNKDNIIYLSALELHTLDTKRVIEFMQARS